MVNMKIRVNIIVKMVLSRCYGVWHGGVKPLLISIPAHRSLHGGTSYLMGPTGNWQLAITASGTLYQMDSVLGT